MNCCKWKQKRGVGKMLNPIQAVVLTTFKCTAACPECCFECSPDNEKILSYQEIVSFLEQCHKKWNMRRVIWSGGECFLLGEDLKRGIAYAKKLGMYSRCVTNGFWATSEEIAYEKLKELHQLGLEELNLSTGDEHQLYVPQDRILNATIAAAKLNMRVVISIETREKTKVTREKFINDPRYQAEIENTELKKFVSILSAIWVSYHKDTVFEYSENSEDYVEYKGCDSLFESICLTPNRTIVGCCGLSVEHIPEMTIGNFGEDLSEILEKQFHDFLKIWLYVDGPKKILDYVKEWENNIEIPKFMHTCQACAFIYQNKRVQEIINNNFKKCYTEVLERFKAKQTLKNAKII